MLRNNADVRRCSYFELGLPVPKPDESESSICQHSSTDKNVDWRNVFQAANTCTTSSKLIDFNFRFLHRRLPTNSYLQKIGVKEDGKCTFCRDEREDLTHLFWKCQKTKNFGIISRYDMASVVPDPPTRQLLRNDYRFGPNARQLFL